MNLFEIEMKLGDELFTAFGTARAESVVKWMMTQSYEDYITEKITGGAEFPTFRTWDLGSTMNDETRLLLDNDDNDQMTIIQLSSRVANKKTMVAK